MKTELAINSLVLCKLASSGAGTSVKHKDASAKLARSSGASKRAARVYTTLVERKGTPVGKAAALVQTCQKTIRKLALPCPSIAGASYVRAIHVDDVQRIVDDAAAKLAEIRRDIVTEWPQLVANGAADLGDLARTVEWPSATEFANEFTISVMWLGQPAPISGTVLEAVSTETAARVRASSEAAVRRDLLEAHGHPVRELIGSLVETVEQIRHGKRLRSERLDGIRQWADEIASKNWLALPELDSLVESLRGSVDGLHDAAALTRTERLGVADAVEQARLKAAETLASLGL
jgi:hypothetical protein